MSPPLFIDTNIPMYAAGQQHPYRSSCARLLADIAEARVEAVIDIEVIQEVLYRFGALHRWEIGYQMASNLMILFKDVLPVTVEDARLAVDLFQRYAPQGIPARDLIHVAVMQSHSITEVVSTDAHFDHIEGLTRIDPLSLYS